MLIPGWNPNAKQDATLWECYRRARIEQLKAGREPGPILKSRASIAGFVRSHAFRADGYWYRNDAEAAACADFIPGEWEPAEPEPTETPPGTTERVQVYSRRVAMGMAIFHECDSGATA